MKSRSRSCPSGCRLKVYARLPTNSPYVGNFHYSPSAGNSSYSFFEAHIVPEEEMARLHRIKSHPLTGNFHSRPGHYSKLHGLQNYQSPLSPGPQQQGRLAGGILDRIRHSLTDPGHVTSTRGGMERISSTERLSDFDMRSARGSGAQPTMATEGFPPEEQVEFYSVSGLAINGLVSNNYEYASNSHANIRMNSNNHVHNRHRSRSPTSSRDGQMYASPRSPTSSTRSMHGGGMRSPSRQIPYQQYDGPIDNHHIGHRYVGSLDSSDAHVPIDATHWGQGGGMGMSTSPVIPHSGFLHMGEPLIGATTSMLRHLYHHPHNAHMGPGGRPRAGSSTGMSTASGNYRAGSSNRRGPVAVGMAWESHTIQAQAKTEEYIQNMEKLAADMKPNDVLLDEITAAYELSDDVLTGTAANADTCLGTGAYSTVHAAVHRSSGRLVAIKKINKRYLFTDAELAAVNREIANQRRLCHRGVVRLYETYESPQHLYLVLERVQRGTLDDLLFLKRRLSELEAKLLFHQILEAVLYCHSQGVVHCDIKPANILLGDVPRSDNPEEEALKELNSPSDNAEPSTSSGDPPSSLSGVLTKICDFGHSRKVPDVKYYKYSGDINRIPLHLYKHTGTDGHIAPEVLIQEPYGKAIDIWSAGIILYRLLSGVMPWSPARKCLESPLLMKSRVWESISSHAQDLLTGLLVVDQNQRLTATEALNHAWFSGISHCVAMPIVAPGNNRISII